MTKVQNKFYRRKYLLKCTQFSFFQDVFVIDPFEGPGFEYLARFKPTIVGPRCLLACLVRNISVPTLPYPMYTASMQSLIVTSTNFSKEQKNEIQLRVEI